MGLTSNYPMKKKNRVIFFYFIVTAAAYTQILSQIRLNRKAQIKKQNCPTLIGVTLRVAHIHLPDV